MKRHDLIPFKRLMEAYPLKRYALRYRIELWGEGDPIWNLHLDMLGYFYDHVRELDAKMHAPNASKNGGV